MTTTKTSNSNSTALVPVTQYAILGMEGQTVLDILRENLGNAPLSLGDLDRVKVPSGGSLTWSVPSLDGESEVKELVGIVAAWRPARVYWKTPYDQSGGGSPPDCASDDGLTGLGEPGGDCLRCPYDRYGSDLKGGKGKACQERILMFLLRPESLMPCVVNAPPTSIQSIKHYFLRLADRQLPYYSVTTRLALTREKNDGGINYAVITPTLGEKLMPEHVARIKAYANALRPALARVRLENQDVEEKL